MRFMYLDECKDRSTNAVSLTALVIDDRLYNEFRDCFFRSLETIIHPKENTFCSIPELHGSKFLPGARDEERISIQRTIFSVIEKIGARIYRCGYYRDGSFPPEMGADDSLLSLAFLGIQFQAQKEFEDELILPIMDGVHSDISKLVGASNHSTQGYRACGMAESNICIQNYKNIADPVVSDSRFSVGTQCVDVVSYALHCKDWIAAGLQSSSYKTKLVEAAKGLQSCIRANEIIRMKMVG